MQFMNVGLLVDSHQTIKKLFESQYPSAAIRFRLALKFESLDAILGNYDRAIQELGSSLGERNEVEFSIPKENIPIFEEGVQSLRAEEVDFPFAPFNVEELGQEHDFTAAEIGQLIRCGFIIRS